MRKVFLITGFQNWGKTFLIYSIFERKRFLYDSLYSFANHDFCVQSQSNDDLGADGFKKIINERLTKLANKGINPSHICAAFCPTKEEQNSSKKIIEDIFTDDDVHLIAIEHKWCLHGRLDIENIRDYYSSLKNVTVHVLSEMDANKKCTAMNELMVKLLESK